jgi:hypothetical protein
MPIPDRTALILDRLCTYLGSALADGALALGAGDADGRVNSQENERQISDALRLFTHSNDWFRGENLSLEVAEPRFWYDFCVHADGLFIPVNVKVSTFRTADNLSSKEGLFYALTGVDPKTVNINSWERFCGLLAENLGRNRDADYFFLAVSKTTSGDVFWTTLKSLAALRSSGSNYPYQCCWADNRVRQERSFEESTRFLLGIVRESFAKGAEPLQSFDRHLREFI